MNVTPSASDLTLLLTRVFDAPRGLVYRAWTEHMNAWAAPAGFTIPESEGDVRPGGAWRTTMRAPNGDEYRLGGVYRELVGDELISFTHVWDEDGTPGQETIVTAHFADEGGGTRLTFKQRGFRNIESRDSHAGGWSECFDRLDDFLKTPH